MKSTNTEPREPAKSPRYSAMTQSSRCTPQSCDQGIVQCQPAHALYQSLALCFNPVAFLQGIDRCWTHPLASMCHSKAEGYSACPGCPDFALFWQMHVTVINHSTDAAKLPPRETIMLVSCIDAYAYPHLSEWVSLGAPA